MPVWFSRRLAARVRDKAMRGPDMRRETTDPWDPDDEPPPHPGDPDVTVETPEPDETDK